MIKASVLSLKFIPYAAARAIHDIAISHFPLSITYFVTMLGWLYQRWQKKRSIIATVACNASDVSEPNQSHTTIDSILASPRRFGVAESSLARASLIEGSLLAICIEYIACRLYEYNAADLCAIPGDLLALILDKRAWAGQSDSGIVNTRSISHLLHGIEGKGEMCLDLDTVILAAPPRRSFSA